MSKGHVRISSVGPDNKADYKFSHVFTDIVTQTEEGISIDLPEGFTLPDARYALEMWMPRASCDPMNIPESYTYIRSTNSPELHRKWEQMEDENVAALHNSSVGQITWPSADELRPYRGKWVAILDARVVHQTETMKELVAWMRAEDPDFSGCILRVPNGTEESR